MSEQAWVRSGNGIFFSPISSPTTIAPGIYEVIQSHTGELFLNYIYEKYSIPKKTYGLDTGFINRVLTRFKSGNRNLGVILNGLKGTGKTVTAKIIANESNLPIIMVNHGFQGLPQLINRINFECIIFVDEYEKVFPRDERGLLLSCMDGAQTSQGKILYLFTTNNTSINENLKNRPGRVRYVKEYRDIDKATISEILDDCLKNPALKEDAMKTIASLNPITIDIVMEMVNESNLFNEPMSAFKGIFNVNREITSRAYKITRIDTGEVLYPRLGLNNWLNSTMSVGQTVWFDDNEHSGSIVIKKITGQESFVADITDPEWEELTDPEEESMTQEQIDEHNEKSMLKNIQIQYEIAIDKHWMFSGD